MQTQTVNISLPKDLLKRTDEVTKREYRSRSELIRELLRNYVEEKEEWELLFKAGERAMKEMGITSEEEVNNIVSDYRHGKKTR